MVSFVISIPPPSDNCLASNSISLLLVSITGSNDAPVPFPPEQSIETITSISKS